MVREEQPSQWGELQFPRHPTAPGPPREGTAANSSCCAEMVPEMAETVPSAEERRAFLSSLQVPVQRQQQCMQQHEIKWGWMPV